MQQYLKISFQGGDDGQLHVHRGPPILNILLWKIKNNKNNKKQLKTFFTVYNSYDAQVLYGPKFPVNFRHQFLIKNIISVGINSTLKTEKFQNSELFKVVLPFKIMMTITIPLKGYFTHLKIIVANVNPMREFIF